MTDGRLRGLIGLLARFGLAGLANTAVGFAVIAGLDLGLHVQPQLANAAGYVVGIGMGFALNRKFVFGSTGKARGEFARYLVVVAVAFLANQAVLLVAHAVLGDGKLDHLLAQFSGMATYTVLTFVLSRYFVFSRAASASTAGQSASNT
jgi:putative flippase GtrA